MSDFEQGDRCRFIKAHPSMNRVLQRRVGHEGVVLETAVRPHDGKHECLVKFDETDSAYGRWWILADRLEHTQSQSGPIGEPAQG